MNKILTFFVLIVLSFSNVGSSSEFEDSRAKDIEILFNELADSELFNGAVLVAEEGDILFKDAFGEADFDSGRLLTNNSSFYIASLSKQFTAMSIMMLAEEKKLDYEDTLSKYFPEFSEYADSITIKHLLNHTSGIRNHARSTRPRFAEGLRNSDVLEILLDHEDVNFLPNEKFEYSNSGYVLLAMIAEIASGQPFHELLQDKIFNPLNMSSTRVYDESRPEIPNKAIGFTGLGERFEYNILTTGEGGMYSTIEDLYIWDQALYSKPLVEPESLEAAFSGAILNNGERTNYGFGWAVRGNKVNHSGGFAGFRSFIMRDIDNQRVIILLMNKLTGINLGELSSDIQEILDRPYLEK